MKISVVLTAYNGEKFLPPLLESILGQTLLPDEIIICDDSRSDATAAAVAPMVARSGGRMVYLRNPERLGMRGNWEKMVATGAGDLILLGDHDDLWLPDKVERFRDAALSAPDADGFFSDSVLMAADGRDLGVSCLAMRGFTPRERVLFPGCDQWRLLLRKSVISGHNMAIRARARRYLLPFPEFTGLYGDSWLTLAIAYFSRWELLDRPLTKFRVHASNASGPGRTSWAAKAADAQKALRNGANLSYMTLLETLRAHPEPSAAKLALLNAKLDFLRFRETLNHLPRPVRLPALWRRRKDYVRFANGAATAMVDLLLR